MRTNLDKNLSINDNQGAPIGLARRIRKNIEKRGMILIGQRKPIGLEKDSTNPSRMIKG